MKTTITAIIVSLFVLGCGGATKTVNAPPWKHLVKAEQERYTTVYACPEATSLVALVKAAWLAEGPEMGPDVDGVYSQLLTDGMGNYVLSFYAKHADGTRTDVMVITDTDNIALEYNTFRRVEQLWAGFQAGALSPEEFDRGLSAAIGEAKGKYFCFYMREGRLLFEH